MNLLRSVLLAFGSGVSYLQHLMMKLAVATSLKLCIFTARVLMNSSQPAQRQAGQL